MMRTVVPVFRFRIWNGWKIRSLKALLDFLDISRSLSGSFQHLLSSIVIDNVRCGNWQYYYVSYAGNQRMAFLNTRQWNSLETWRATAFLFGGLIFAGDAALVAYNIAAGTEQFMELGQAFVGAGWTAAFIGLIGFYPDLAERTRWPARIGAVFAVIGGIAMAVMALTSLSYFTGLVSGGFEDVGMFFLPPVFVGIVLGFGSFGVAVLLTEVYTRSVGGLFLLLPLTFLFNLATGMSGIGSLTTVLIVVCVLMFTLLAVSYLLRTGSALVDRR